MNPFESIRLTLVVVPIGDGKSGVWVEKRDAQFG